MLPLVHYIRYENPAQKGKEQNQCCCQINLDQISNSMDIITCTTNI